jgi:hypothetical protein
MSISLSHASNYIASLAMGGFSSKSTDTALSCFLKVCQDYTFVSIQSYYLVSVFSLGYIKFIHIVKAIIVFCHCPVAGFEVCIAENMKGWNVAPCSLAEAH